MGKQSRGEWAHHIPILEDASGLGQHEAKFSDDVPREQLIRNVAHANRIWDIVCDLEQISPIGNQIIKAIALNGDLSSLSPRDIDEIHGQ